MASMSSGGTSSLIISFLRRLAGDSIAVGELAIGPSSMMGVALLAAGVVATKSGEGSVLRLARISSHGLPSKKLGRPELLALPLHSGLLHLKGGEMLFRHFAQGGPNG